MNDLWNFFLGLGDGLQFLRLRFPKYFGFMYPFSASFPLQLHLSHPLKLIPVPPFNMGLTFELTPDLLL